MSDYFLMNQDFKYAITSALSFEDGSPTNAIEFPGAKSAGDFSHLSKLPSVHFRVPLPERAALILSENSRVAKAFLRSNRRSCYCA